MAELPHPRNVELLVTEVNVPSPCCSCGKKDGDLKCSWCKGVVYCSQECQDKGWNHHRQICNATNQLIQEVKAAIEALANRYGGKEAFLEAPIVKKGLFTFRYDYASIENPSHFWIHNDNGPTLTEKYEIARLKLIEAYAICGKESLSGMAFRLAAENLLHMLRLCRSQHQGFQQKESTWHKYCGWMVAGGMDQQALNFLSYVISGGEGLDFLDLSVDEDIEGVSVVSIVKENIIKASPLFTLRMENHDFMLISLIKYKRIQELSVQRMEEEERWNVFMEGTQPMNGESSVVFMISGMAPVLENLKEFVVGTSHGRIHSLTNQINDLLNAVNESNPKLIPGILDRQVKMVDNPTFPETGKDKVPKELFGHYGIQLQVLPGVENDIHKARYGVGKYGHAWHIDKDCTTALRLFFETGNVMAEDTGIQTLQVFDKDTNGGGFEEMKAIKFDGAVSNGKEDVSGMDEKDFSEKVKEKDDEVVTVVSDREEEASGMEEKGKGSELSIICDNTEDSQKFKENDDGNIPVVDDKDKADELFKAKQQKSKRDSV